MLYNSSEHMLKNSWHNNNFMKKKHKIQVFLAKTEKKLGSVHISRTEFVSLPLIII